MYIHNTEELSRSIFFFFFCTTLIYIKRYKIAITIITVVHRYHWRYHSTLATTLLHDLHDLWHRGYQDSTTIHAFTRTRTHTHTRTHARTFTHVSQNPQNLISFLAASFFFCFFFFFKVTRNTECCLQLLNLGFLASQSHRLEINNVDLFPPWRFSSYLSILCFFFVSFFKEFKVQ